MDTKFVVPSTPSRTSEEIEEPLEMKTVDASNKRSSEFSSENHKLEILNLPSHTKYHVVKKLLEGHYNLKPHKIRVGDKKAYVAFMSTEERDEAIATINNQDWKGKVLVAKPAAPRHDPLIKKQRTNSKQGSEDQDYEEENEPTDDDINDQVCPLWKSSYEEQLLTKERFVKSVLNMGKKITKLSPSLKRDAPLLHEWVERHPKICCQFDGVETSPLKTGYRNKCEFSVGRDGIVGFRMGRYKNGSERVRKPPKNCPIVNEIMFPILDSLQNFLDGHGTCTRLTGFDQVSHDGNIRQVTIRKNETNECLIIIDIHPQELTSAELDKEMEAIVAALKPDKRVVSIYINLSTKNHMTSRDQTLKLVYGQEFLYERLAVDPNQPLKFRIGPTSFFQVNTKAAEILYRSIIDIAQLDEKSLVLDVGCGTGTIGLSLARQVSYVIGIEVVDSAIADAKMNATENNIENVSFFAGTAEDLIGESICILKKKLEEQNNKGNIVAIVDPPRIGFNNSFVKVLRASNIKKIIYVACDPAANTNLISLCRPKSKAYQGDPFVPVRAKAVDLFPHTKCCELVMVYERLVQDQRSEQQKSCEPASASDLQ